MLVRWVAFPLHPETPAEGQTLEQLFVGQDINVQEALDHLASVAAKLGLEWSSRNKTYNSRLAQELGKWAEQQGKGDEFHHAMFRAYFVEGRNIGKTDVLEETAATLGLEREAVRKALLERPFREDVDRDWQRSRMMGITAVPTVVAGGKAVVGFQGFDGYRRLLESVGAALR